VQRRLTESADLFLRLDQSLKRSRSCASAHLRPAPPLWLTVVLCTCVFVRMCMRACKPKRARVAGSCVRALVSQWAFVCPHGSAGCVGMRRLPSGVLADQAQEALQELRQGMPYCAGADVSCRLSLVADRHSLRLNRLCRAPVGAHRRTRNASVSAARARLCCDCRTSAPGPGRLHNYRG
jgi:hypothetical protein